MNTLFLYKLAKFVTLHKNIKQIPGGVRVTKIKAHKDRPEIKNEEIEIGENRLKTLQESIRSNGSEMKEEVHQEEEIDI